MNLKNKNVKVLESKCTWIEIVWIKSAKSTQNKTIALIPHDVSWLRGDSLYDTFKN